MDDPAAREVAGILRGLKDRVADLEERRRQGGSVTLIRQVTENALASDSVTVTEDTAPGMEWDAGATADAGWDESEWG